MIYPVPVNPPPLNPAKCSVGGEVLACHQALCFTCYPAVEGILLVAFVHICPQSVHTCVALLQVDVLNQGYGVDVEEDSHDRELDDAPD